MLDEMWLEGVRTSSNRKILIDGFHKLYEIFCDKCLGETSHSYYKLEAVWAGYGATRLGTLFNLIGSGKKSGCMLFAMLAQDTVGLEHWFRLFPGQL